MPAVNCPYCGKVNYTSYPEVLEECAYCNQRFAEVDTGNCLLIIIDSQLKEADQMAKDLKEDWERQGLRGREVIVDRRSSDGAEFKGSDNRQVPTGLTIRYRLS